MQIISDEEYQQRLNLRQQMSREQLAALNTDMLTAARFGEARRVAEFLALGADENAVDPSLNTGIHLGGFESCALYFLEGRANPHIANKQGLRQIETHIRRSNLLTFKVLYRHLNEYCPEIMKDSYKMQLFRMASDQFTRLSRLHGVKPERIALARDIGKFLAIEVGLRAARPATRPVSGPNVRLFHHTVT